MAHAFRWQILLLLLPLSSSFPFSRGKLRERRRTFLAKTDKNDEDESFWRKTLNRGKESVSSLTGKEDYEFGDISRWVDARVKERVNKVTQKDEYEFGDLSRWVDARVKDGVNKVTQKDEYEFGDLSRWVDARVKDRVNEMTGKSSYDFGDLSKAIATRVISRRYVLEDIVILLKALVSLNVGMSSVASFLPVKLLVDLLNYSLAADVGNRVVAALAIEVDKRVKEALTGDANYELGDYTKRAILQFIGKDAYSFGDISRKIVANMEFDEAESASESASDGVGFDDQGAPSIALAMLGPPPLLFAGGETEVGEEPNLAGMIDPFILRELEQWDAVFEKRQMAEASRAAGTSSVGGGGGDD